MRALIQFIVLKREGRWLVKSMDLERFFPIHRQAINTAIRFANDRGKEGSQEWCYCKNRKPNSRRFGHTERAPIRPLDRIYLWCRGRRSRKNWRRPSGRRSAAVN